jgi:hypothetical protein
MCYCCFICACMCSVGSCSYLCLYCVLLSVYLSQFRFNLKRWEGCSKCVFRVVGNPE